MIEKLLLDAAFGLGFIVTFFGGLAIAGSIVLLVARVRVLAGKRASR